MTVYIVDIETRKHDRDDTLGPFSTFEKAQEAIKDHTGWSDKFLENHKEFGSDWSKGEIYTTETSAVIMEREIE